MSFTGEVKNEVSKLDIIDTEKISELSAIIKNSVVTENIIKIQTENNSVARRIYALVKDIYHKTPKITVRKGYNYNKNLIYILEINNDIKSILYTLGITKKLVPEDYIVDDDSLIRSYLRGVFLITGSINDPKKSRYHLEFLIDNEQYAFFVMSLLNKFRLNSKVLKRENKYMVYIKEAEKIGDFLRVISASNAVMYYEDIRIYRDHKNMTNRLNNCEQANVDKIIETANEQVRNIELIIDNDSFDLLGDKEQEAANYRLKYNEVSIQELSEIISLETQSKISKSGLYHRLNKIKTLANKIRKTSFLNH